MLTLHWRLFLGAEAGILVVLGVTALVNLKLAAWLVHATSIWTPLVRHAHPGRRPPAV